MQTPHTCRENK